MIETQFQLGWDQLWWIFSLGCCQQHTCLNIGLCWQNTPAPFFMSNTDKWLLRWINILIWPNAFCGNKLVSQCMSWPTKPLSLKKKSTVYRCCLITVLCLTLCDPMDCSPPGSSVHGMSQARILEWVAISSSRGSSQPMDQTRISYFGGQLL